MTEIKLKVMEALQEEAYKGIVRIDSQTMKDLSAHPGDVLEITGNRATVGIVDRAYPTDVGQNIIRMDGILRRNAKTGIGENVTVKKADIKEAKSITIAPAQKGVMVRADPYLFKKTLLGRAVVTGDIIVPGGSTRRRRTMSDSSFFDDTFSLFEDLPGSFGFGNLFSSLRFMIVSTTPKQPVIITENTEVVLSEKSVEITEEQIPEVTYEDVGGLKEEITKIREMVELPLKHPEIFIKLGIEPPKGILLHGPPGTGKTLLAKAVANESGVNFILVNGPEIVNKFYGESEKRIRDIFDNAEKQAPSIIFFDELDSIAPKREETYGELERRVVSQILTQMDGLKSRGKVIVIGATNRPNSLDPALRRPGRFDREIAISVPNKEGRLNILKIHTRNMPIEGNFYEDIASEELINNINEEQINLNKNITSKQSKISSLKSNIEVLQSKISSLKSNIEVLQSQLEELESKKSLRDENLINQLLNLINKTKDKINYNKKQFDDLNKELIESKKETNDLNKKIAELNLDINKIKETKEYLEKEKSELKKIIEIIKSIEHFEEIWGTEDPRVELINITKKKELSEKVQLIMSNLIELNVINKNFYKGVRQKGVPRDLNQLAEIIHGFVGADIAALCKEAAMNVLRRILPDIKLGEKEEISKEILEKLIVEDKDFRESLKIVRPSALREVLIENPNVKWEDVGGAKEIQQELKEAIEWPLKYSNEFKKIGVKAPKGILLYGPPGTGKTLLAKAVANESGVNFILVRGPELLNKFVGESEKGIRKIFEKARQASPAIIFFDEIDSIAPRRGLSNNSQAIEGVINTLLSEMDGLEELNDIVVMAATNRPDILDPALLRPGRFDRLCLVGATSKEERLEILKIHTKPMPLAKDVDLNKIAEKTDGYTGADLEAVCREAGILTLRNNIKAKEFQEETSEEIKEEKQKVKKIKEKPIKKIEEELEVKNKFFEEALKKVRPSVTKELMDKYKAVEENYLKQAKAAITKDIPTYVG